MKLILVRHGETKEEKKKILLGSLPGILTTRGISFACNIGHTIVAAKLHPTLIITSDLKRAKDTARIIAQTLRIPKKMNHLLRERRSGVAEGKTEREIDWEKYKKHLLAYRRHGCGESFIDVKKRAHKFLLQMRKEKHKSVVIVSHSAFLSMLFVDLLSLSYTKALKFNFRDKLVVVDIKKAEAEFYPILLRK